MQKNKAGKWVVYAYGTTTDLPVTGDAANITADVHIDGGSANAVDDTNPAELGNGYYVFDIIADESDGDLLLINAVSSTGNVRVIGKPETLFTVNEIAEVVWDEILTGATHNIATSAGRRLRGLQEFQGYENGAIWIDTINGTVGATVYENGTVENPVLTLANAVTLNASLRFNRFHVHNGSSIRPMSTFIDYMFYGENWTLDLGNQNLGGTHFHGATVTGISTGAETAFIHCHIGDVTIDLMHFESCSLSGDIIVAAIGSQHIANCHSDIAGSTTPTFDLGAAIADSNINFRNYSGGIEFKNIGQSGSDMISIEGNGQVILNSNCIGGQINIRGNFELTDNSSDPFTTIIDDARYDAPRQTDLVLDEINTGGTHNVTNSLGRQIRELRETNVYDGGRIWIDTINGAAGSEDYVNGTVDNPVNNIADAATLSTSLGINRFDISPASVITLATDFVNYIFSGENWTLNLGGQDMSGSVIHGATLNGICTGAIAPDFSHCVINNITVPPCHFRFTNLSGTTTAGSAGDFFFDLCHSAVAGMGAPIFDFGAVIGDTNLNFRHYSGGIQIENMGDTGTDTMSLEGNGQFIEGTCTGGIAAIRGNFSLSGIINLTINDSANITATLSDTGAIKAKTDELAFTKANELDSNIKSINDVTIVGDGDSVPFTV